MMIRDDSGTLAVVIPGLFVFGFVYNYLVHYLESRGYHEGYTAFLVVGGVIVTLVASAILIGQAVMYVVVCFVASGLPMIVGSMYRNMKLRESARNAIAGLLHDQAARTRK